MNNKIFIYRFLIVVLLIGLTIGKSYGNTNEYKVVELKSKNSILTQSMLKTPNTRYIIKNDLNLNHTSINIPHNCILVFEGGSLKDGEITGDFIVHADAVPIFDDVVCKELKNHSIPIEWYGAVSYKSLDECKKGKDSSKAIQNSLKSNIRQREILFSNGYYRINNTITIDRSYVFKGLNNKNDYNNDEGESIGSRLFFTAVGKPMFIVANNFVSFDGFNFYHGSSRDATDCFHFSDKARSLTIKNSMLYAWRYCIYKEWDGISLTGLNRCLFENVNFSSCVGGVYMNQTKEGKEMYYCTANFFDNCTFEYCHFGAYFISNSNFEMIEFNRCNFHKIGWGKYYNQNIYKEFGSFALRFKCTFKGSQSSHVLVKECYFENNAPFVKSSKVNNGELRIGENVYPINDQYYSCIISENNSMIIDGCTFRNCPKFLAGDKYCSWDIRDNTFIGYNIKIPSQWNNKTLLQIFPVNTIINKGNQNSTIYYSNVIGITNPYIKQLVSFKNNSDKNQYRIVNLFEDKFIDVVPVY